MPSFPRVALLCLGLAAALITSLLFRSAFTDAAPPLAPAASALTAPVLSVFTQLASIPAAPSASSAPAPAFYRRTRPLRIDPSFASSATLDPAAQIGQRLSFELFDDIAWDGLVTRAETIGPERVNLYGQLEGVAGSDFIVTLQGTEAAAMSFTTPGTSGRYQVRTAAPGQLLAIELASELLPPCAHDHTAATPDPALAQQARQHAALLTQHAAEVSLPGSSYGSFGQQGGSVGGLTFTNVDVMIAYTAAAQSGAGGAAGITALADHMVARANATFINSRVGLRLRLVRLQPVAYTEPGNISTDLNRLTNPSDGFLDTLHATRTAVGADLVTLVTENTGGFAGLAWLYDATGGDAAYGFNVVQRPGCESTYVHEVGHNFGCEHDRANSSGPTIYPYAFGHRFTPVGYGQLRTVMAYAPGDAVPYFSNPDVTYLGMPTGMAVGSPGEAHNAQVLNNTKAALAAFRATAGNQPPAIALTSPTETTSLVALQNVALAATATDPDGSVASVRFYQLSDDSRWNFSNVTSVSLGSDTTAPYQQTAAAAAGYLTFAAVATDNSGAVSTATVSVTIAPWYRQERLSMPVGYTSDLDLVAINSAGQIAGTVKSAAPFFRAARWTGTTPTLLAPLPGDVSSTALAIGEDGIVYGQSISDSDVRRAVRWSPAGTATDLSTAVVGQTLAAAFGQDGIGRSLYDNTVGRGYRNATTAPLNFISSAIASSGIVGGTDYVFGSVSAWRAARWDGGDTSTALAPQPTYLSSWGWALNRTGAVVGISSPTSGWSGTNWRATYWPANTTTPIDIAPLGSTASTAESINDHNEIVGYFGSPFNTPFLWRADLGSIDLGKVVLPSPDADLQRAQAINNRGVIAIEASDGAAFVPVRLTPLGGLSHSHWASTHFSLVEFDAALLLGDTADPDGDSLPNLIERAFNLNPRVASAAYSSTGYPALGFDEVADKLTLTFHRLRAPSDVTYTVEATSNLAGTWSSAGAVEVSRTALNADWDEVVYQSTSSPGPGTPVFLRVRVSR